MPQGHVISIGNFDGVHLGHQALLSQARRVADRLRARLLAITFDPPPVARLRPDAQPARLMPLAQRIRTLKANGADDVTVMDPTARLLETEPEAFVEQLCQQHHVAAFVEGPNFRFGKDRRGDVQLLQKLGQSMQFELHVVGPKQITLSNHLQCEVSSSLVRWLMRHGRTIDATLALGRPVTLLGQVHRGEQRGRHLGFPTLNLAGDLMQHSVLPGPGVYAGLAAIGENPRAGRADDDPSLDWITEPGQAAPHRLGQDAPWRMAAISVGMKPTFQSDRLTVEAHLLDFHQDIYGRHVAVAPMIWLRDQQAFPNVQLLQQQLHRDVMTTKRMGDAGRLDPADLVVRFQPEMALGESA